MGVISRVTILISQNRGLLTLFIATHEPPSGVESFAKPGAKQTQSADVALSRSFELGRSECPSFAPVKACLKLRDSDGQAGRVQGKSEPSISFKVSRLGGERLRSSGF